MILRLPPTHPVGQSVVNRLIGLPLNAAARRSGDGLMTTSLQLLSLGSGSMTTPLLFGFLRNRIPPS